MKHMKKTLFCICLLLCNVLILSAAETRKMQKKVKNAKSIEVIYHNVYKGNSSLKIRHA